MEKISQKRYKTYKLLTTILLIIIMGSFVALGNFIAALIVFAIAIFIMIILRKNAKGVLNDERIERIAGKAFRIVMATSALLMAAGGIVLVSLRNTYPQYLIIGNILIYLECGMMLFYAILFKYYFNKKI